MLECQMGVSRVWIRQSRQKMQVKDSVLRLRSANRTFLRGILDGRRGSADRTGMQLSPPNGHVCKGRVMARLPHISIGVRNLPSGPHVAQFSPNYLEFRPWKPSPNDLMNGRVPFQR